MISKVYRRIVAVVLVVALTLVLVVATKDKGTHTGQLWIDSFAYHSVQPTQQYEAAKAKLLTDHHNDVDPCTVVNPINGGFIDLRGLSAEGNEGRALAWTSRGYDSGKNYTLGVCSSPFKQQHDNDGELQDNVNSTLVGGFYIDHTSNKYVSIGQFNTTPVFRGRKLTLTYGNGSYCDISDANGNRLRKSSTLTFTCDREMMQKAQISYIGSANDCHYVFEVRSHHACPTAAKENSYAVVWIFLLIFLAALAVYLSGSVYYRQIRQAIKA